MSAATPNRLDELLAARATWGLSAAETRELERMLPPGRRGPGAHELAAAAIHLAFAHELEPTPEPLPSALRERLVASAARTWDEKRNRPT